MEKLLQTLKSISWLLILFVVGAELQAQTSPAIYTTSGTFTVPAGVYQVTVEAWGAGGRGGSCLSNNGMNVGGGGGGGAYAAKSIAVTPGTTYTVTVGLGSSTTAPGGDSWFISNTTVLAKGGNSCGNNVKVGATGGQASASIGDLKSTGGSGANGIDNVSGGGGGAGAEAGDIGVSPSANNYLGAVATCYGGNGGNAYISENGDGFPGMSPGGGGGGGKRNNNNGSNSGIGGRGGDGRVIIRWGNGTPLPTLTYGPGGVTSDLQLWLRSDLLQGTTTIADNANVTLWQTQARGSDATKPSPIRAPKFRNNATHNINFNPVVDFTNDYNTTPQVYTNVNPEREYLTGTSGFYSQEIFVVVMPDIQVTNSLKSMDVFCGDRLPCEEIDKTGIGFGNFTSRFSNEVLTYCLGPEDRYGAAQVNTSAAYNGPGIVNSRINGPNSGMQLTYNGVMINNSEVNSSTFRNVYDSRYWIGRSEGWDGSLDGRVAEIITFSARKNDTSERNRIQSYLAIKYGITLGANGTGDNYYASNGATVWNASQNSGYNFNIAGIGRDESSKLLQKQSKSVNTDSMLTIGLGNIAATNSANTSTFSTDRSYLMWGDNGSPMEEAPEDLTVTFGASTTTVTDLSLKRWKFVETGNVGEVKISIPTTSLAHLPELAGNDEYVMIISTGEEFNENLEMVFLKASGANHEAFYDFDGTRFVTFGVAHETVLPRHATLNGESHNIVMGNANNLPISAFTMMFWVRPTGDNATSTDKTIVAKTDGVTGYRVALTPENRLLIEWDGGTTHYSITALPHEVWHHVAIVYSSGSTRIFIDGVLDSTVSTAAPAVNTHTFSIGSEYRSKTDILNHFRGDIDEFRLWNTALQQSAIRFVMNQELAQINSGTRGTILPTTLTKNDISSLFWANLTAYYSMNSFIGTHINDDSANSNRGLLTVPEKVDISVQSAPMPYESEASGNWTSASTWKNGSTQDLPYSPSIVNPATFISWNIVKTSHNIESQGNRVVLGLMVESNELDVTNHTKMEVSHYLKLNGKIDLEGRSQLIQTLNSDLDVASSGTVERDQQGHSNMYNYNYWSSPVGSTSTSQNNTAYTVAGVLRDGTNPANPQTINWTSGMNSIAGSPITLSSYWIFKFQNVTNAYANWSAVGPNGTLLAGQGFTLKGSNASTANQNLTFVGKPNNGSITSPIAANNLSLVGNPYASAIDANTFINENITSITGTLYFWEHYSTNNSHWLADYQGGYATRNLVGGTPPIAPSYVSGLGSSTRTPRRYIPVGQAFFVTGSTAGGNVRFNNNHRSFVKEDNASNSNYMFRADNTLTAAITPVIDTNEEDTISTDNFFKVRLGYNSTSNYHRQVLLGFMEDNATSAIDKGYDALHIDSQPSDMYFNHIHGKLNIQGDAFFSSDKVYPLGVKNAVAGVASFVVDETENLPAGQKIYIFDAETGLHHDITDNKFEISLPAGTIETRFSLKFDDGAALGTGNPTSLESMVAVAFAQQQGILNVKNTSGEELKSAALFNMVGQQVATWSIESQDQENISLPVKNLSTGTYIVKLSSDKTDVSRKIMIK